MGVLQSSMMHSSFKHSVNVQAVNQNHQSAKWLIGYYIYDTGVDYIIRNVIHKVAGYLLAYCSQQLLT